MMPAADRHRILVVDDIELSRVMTAAALREDYDVESACDGAAALTALGRTGYDLVLMDLDMPGLDGFETAEAFRRSSVPHHRRALVVALSALGDAASIRRARLAGMDDHIARPIGPRDLKREVGLLIERRAVEASAPVWRRDRYDEIVVRLGADRAETFLRHLLDRFAVLEASSGTPAAPSSDLARQAHDLGSSAGMFGFEEVCQLCRVVQNGVAPDAPEVPRLAEAIERARALIHRQLYVSSCPAGRTGRPCDDPAPPPRSGSPRLDS